MLSEVANILSIIAYNIDKRYFMSKIIEHCLCNMKSVAKRIEHPRTNRICVRYGYMENH
jgi:hypothetical protein